MFDFSFKAGKGLNILNNRFFNPRSYAGVNISRAGFMILSTLDPKSESAIKYEHCINKAIQEVILDLLLVIKDLQMKGASFLVSDVIKSVMSMLSYCQILNVIEEIEKGNNEYLNSETRSLIIKLKNKTVWSKLMQNCAYANVNESVYFHLQRFLIYKKEMELKNIFVSAISICVFILRFDWRFCF